jgi:hypothetical protein
MKVKKIIRILLIIVISLVLLGFIFANIDYSRITKYQKPFFAIYIGKNKFTHADMYYGLGYTIIKCPEVSDSVISTDNNKYKLYLFSSGHACVLSGDYEDDSNKALDE